MTYSEIVNLLFLQPARLISPEGETNARFEHSAKRGLAWISPLLRNPLPVPGLPYAEPYNVNFATHYTDLTGRRN